MSGDCFIAVLSRDLVSVSRDLFPESSDLLERVPWSDQLNS